MEVYGSYRANILLIREAIAENSQQMGQVDQSLVSFQAGLVGVEREMLPIYTLTERLRETQKNIDLCVQELHRVNENFVAAEKLAPTLINGVGYDQDEYVNALQQLFVAISFLETHRAYEGSAKALDLAREVLVQARKKCKADLLSTIAVISRGARRDDGRLAWGKLNSDVVDRASQLVRCLLNSNCDTADLLEDYAKQRLQVVKSFLSDSDASGVVRFSVLDTVHTLEGQLADVLATLQSEKALAEGIFPTEELACSAFRHVSYQIIVAVKQDLDSSLQTHSNTKQPAGIDPFKLLQLHELLSARLKDIDALAQPPLLLRDIKGGGMQDPWVVCKLLGTLLKDVATTTKQKLFGFLLERTDQISVTDRSLTRDGNVHPASSMMLNFIRHTCDHVKPLKILLARESNVTPSSFVETAVMQLVEALTAKSAQAKSRGDLKHLFLANNFGFVSSSLPTCTDKDVDSHIKSEIKPRLEELRERAIQSFIHTSYGSFATYLCDPTEKLVYAKGGSLLTLESGRLLKEKFSRFNAQIDDIHETQRHYIVAEPVVRQKLVHTAVETVLPRYTTFYDKYSVINFSKKNSTKYLKYNPKAVEQVLKELFLGDVLNNT